MEILREQKHRYSRVNACNRCERFFLNSPIHSVPAFSMYEGFLTSEVLAVTNKHACWLMPYLMLYKKTFHHIVISGLKIVFIFLKCLQKRRACPRQAICSWDSCAFCLFFWLLWSVCHSQFAIVETRFVLSSQYTFFYRQITSFRSFDHRWTFRFSAMRENPDPIDRTWSHSCDSIWLDMF
jgi:hypothetical protein